jgi:hypothetical protein
MDLPADSPEARICSFECTFCASCAEGSLGGRSPNCAGKLLPQPRRPAGKLADYPASTGRIFNPTGCAKAARMLGQV